MITDATDDQYVIDAPRAADPTLCADVACIFQASLAAHQWQDFSEWFALRLAARIGGRYIPKRDDRGVRDAAVWRAFTGRNHKEVMRSFQISRRLLYSILARQRKA